MSFPRELRSECRVGDLLLVAAVPLALLAVYALPEATRRSLVFAYEEPTLLTAYASHSVHLGPEHLLVNLASYLLLVPTAYALAVLGGRRTRFRIGFIAVLVAVPFSLSWLNLLFVRPRVGFGFSGVAMGCLGLLALELFNYGRTSLSLPLSWDDAAMLFFVELALISLAVAPRTATTLAVAGVSAVIAVAYGWHLLRTIDRDAGSEVGTRLGRLREPGFAELAVVGVVLVVAFPFVAFPPRPDRGRRGGEPLHPPARLLSRVRVRLRPPVRGAGRHGRRRVR
ncbi:hypothetical protein HUG10_09330 [Halorarum halophilum]|uniref:Rhomboid family protein n=1 Tax=Halorarum halophilum TaxID=2743090 RepID=A0A7D5KMH6_9EURY|nr:hypothetical protein [Halobaculum halophilum]QLG27742.1 hypothetical protein HUG10_09330 [Halobaculum halophilum]